MNSKKFISTSVGTLMVIQLILPTVLYAQSPDRKDRNGDKQDGEITFCARLQNIASGIDQRRADNQIAIESKINQRKSDMGGTRSKVDEKLKDFTLKWDKNRVDHYIKLEARIKTEAQKAAVATFKSAVESAVATRKTAIDAALISFRQSVDQAIAARKTAIEAATSAFKTSAQLALSKAKADCAAGADSVAVRHAYKASMKAAREKFLNDIKSIEKVNYRAIAETRKQAVQKAIQDFKIALEKAKINLKAAFESQPSIQ